MKKCREIHQRLKEMRMMAISDIIHKLNQILVGYFHYYGITDNIGMLHVFKFRIQQILYKCLNRRSQRRSYTWTQFNELLRDFPLVKERVYVSIYGN